MNLRRTILALFALAPLWWASSAHACAACFGKTDDKLAVGMNAGILSLLVVVVVVLSGIAGFFVYIVKREKQFSPPSDSRVQHELH